MTPSDYSNGNSLAHDRMQADVLDWILEHGITECVIKSRTEEVEMRRGGCWPEVPLNIKGVLRGFVDILERWEPVKISVPKTPVHYQAYEIKPRLTTIGGLIRQMRAEELLIEQWAGFGVKVVIVPVVMHDDPELPLLRRLWSGEVLMWNAEAKTLS